MPDYTPAQPARKGRGCFFYGCLTCVVILLLACLLAIFAARFARNWIADRTDAAPAQLPKVEMADAEFKQLEARVKAFGDAMNQGKSAEPLVLSERDLNALIAGSANTKELAGKFYVSLNGDQVKGQVSIPLSNLGWFFRGRYLNGDASFNVSLENGVLVVTLREVRVKGRPLPDTILGGLRQENLAKDFSQDPQTANAIKKFEGLQVKDGQVI